MQKVGEENVAGILTENVKSEVLEKHMAEMGFINTTRLELTGAHGQTSSQPVGAAQKSSVKFDGLVKAFRGQRAMLVAKSGGGLVKIHDYQITWHCGSALHTLAPHGSGARFPQLTARCHEPEDRSLPQTFSRLQSSSDKNSASESHKKR